jgi:membrane protease YdiL (CAAX protease family)
MLEELGWRGFGVQTAVDGGHSPAWAALLVGAIFILIHAPLYLPGQLYAGLPFWPLPIILLTYSMLLTWIYLQTRSVLLAGLMHASFNATVPLTWGLDPDWVWQARAIVLIIITAVVVLITGIRWWRSSPDAANLQPDQRLPRPAGGVSRI